MHLQFEQTVPVSRDAVFAFHANPARIVALHQNWPAFRLLFHEDTLMRGGRLWFEVNVAHILPVALGFEITECEPPERFSERLIHGPFKTFTHTHTFEEAGAGAVVRDILEIELPLHYGGELVTRALVAPAIRRAFGLRNQALSDLAAAGELTAPERQPYGVNP